MRLIDSKIRKSLNRLIYWLEKQGYSAYDPFDGLSTPVRILTFERKLLRQVLMQSVRRIPINIRPILGIKPSTSTKGLGYIAKGYLKLYEATGERKFLEKGEKLLEKLIEMKSPFYKYLGWGNHFDYQSRGFYLPKGHTTVVWTSLIGRVYVKAFDITGNSSYLKIIDSIANHIVEEIGFEEINKDSVCIKYIPLEGEGVRINCVHNANMLGAAFLAQAYNRLKKQDLLELAIRAINYTVSKQLPNGAWYYAEASNCHWIDNFHTGYVLDALHIYHRETGDKTYLEAMNRGFEFYINHFFTSEGIAKYYHNSVYPIDIQCLSQSIVTLTRFGEIELAMKVADWTIENMQSPEGYFYFRKGRFFTNRTPMLHWGQGTMFDALSTLLIHIERGGY